MLMRRLFSIIAALTFIACAPQARAWMPHGVAGGGGNSPIVLPGATQPTYDNTNSTVSLTKLTNVNYANITPAQHGNSSDYGYNLRTWGQWNDIPLVFVSGTRHIGLLAAHLPTNVEKAAGLDSNVSDVKVRCDEGSYFTITGPSSNPDSGTTDWNFTATDSNFADGLHKCDAIIEPATGPDGVMNGPPFDVQGNGYPYLKLPQIWIDSGTRGTPGHILTVPANESTSVGTNAVLNFNGSTINLSSATISYGWSVTALGVAPGTFIDGDSTHNASLCTPETGSPCDGAGGAGHYHLTGPSQAVYGGTVTGKIDNGSGGAGTTATVTSILTGYSASMGLPMIDGAGVTAGTLVSNGATQTCTTPCTYTVTSSQLVAPTTLYFSASATVGDQTSFYFVTNFNGTIARPTVYFCAGTCNGVTGNDTTGSGTAASPYATIAKAQSIAVTADNGTTFHKGKWGATVCVMNPTGSAGAVVGYSGSFSRPDASLGYVDWSPANQAPCAAPGDPGGVILDQNPVLTTRGFMATHVRWHGVGISTPPSNASGGSAQFFVADHAYETTDALGNSGLMSAGGWMCVESTVLFGSDGGCSGAREVRNMVSRYAFQDCTHDVIIVVGNSCDYFGVPGNWATGTFSSATPTIVTSVAYIPAELSGRALSAVFGSGTSYTLVNASNGANCYGGAGATNISSVNDAGHSITFTSIASSGLCADGSTVYVQPVGAHPDDAQLAQGGLAFHNGFIQDNTYGATAGGGNQGYFPEAEQEDGMYVARNSFKVNPLNGSTGDSVSGANKNIIYSHNVWPNAGSYQHDRQFGGADETLIQDRCVTGGTILPPVQAGVNIRALQAGSNICYSTTTP